MCLTPYTLKRDTKTMQGITTKIVPCGKCNECLSKRRSQWVFRLKQEQKHSISSAFITLTYNDTPKSFNGHETLNPEHLKNFWKRLRKHCNPLQPKHYCEKKQKYIITHPIRYFAVGEYGTKFLRPHYHAIAYNIPRSVLLRSQTFEDQIWKHGITDIAECNGATIGYVASYVINGTWQPTQDDDDRYPEFQRQSQKLGASYLTPQMINFHKQTLNNFLTLEDKHIQSLPRYYKDKIFTPLEKIEVQKSYLAYLKQQGKELNNIYELEYHEKFNEELRKITKLKLTTKKTF